MRQHTLLNAMKGVKLQIKGNIAGKKDLTCARPFLLSINRVFQQSAVNKTAEDPTDNRHNPEEPQLL